MIRRTVNAPLPQDVTGGGSAQPHSQRAVNHPVIHLSDFGVWLIGVRHYFQLDDPSPLNVLVAAFMELNAFPLHKGRPFDPGNDEVTELLRLTVVGADMPAQAIVDQRKRDDFPLGATTGDGVVLDAQRALLMDRPSHTRQHIQIRVREP
ncbi:hypothetical protein D3C77_560800 [compost metagenome]